MLFMLFGAFDILVQRPRCPGNHIDCIISRRPPIHGTWHIRLAASSATAAATGDRHYVCGGVFASHSVVNDDEANTIQSLLRSRRCFCRSLRPQWWKRRYNFNHVAPAAVSLSFASSSMTTKTIQIQSYWQPAWSSFHRIDAVRRSTPIAIDILTLIVIGSALVIQRTFALFCSDVPPFALLWLW